MKLVPKHILVILAVIVGLAIFVNRQDAKYELATKNTPNLPALSQVKHVFVIFEENRNWKEIYNNLEAPFINKTLLVEGAFAQNYHNISTDLGALHPSEPNYIMAVAGKIAFADHTFINNDLPSAANSTASHDHLTYLLDNNNLSWKSYQEDISGNDCPIQKIENYSPKHNPFVFFQDVSGNPPSNNNTYCQTHIRPLGELQSDLSIGNIADYTFISPNMLNNMHDGSINQADNWLAKIVQMITDSAIYKTDTAIFITWDEGSGDINENDPIGMIILSPFVKPGYTNSTLYTHASLVKTIQEIFHLSPLLGLAVDEKTNDLSDFFYVR
ncbi:hypothetical protein A2634_05485 [Candidatus Amesbacteria bacterium RIFCSPHIGHO2_01_FULL_48_32]|uniref:Phosphoesterase n=2 Tax=Microgenomates group TaxID=1794810 RepID=A0A1F4ZAJ0_9BACT|nr:MAG: Phosphoesterase [Candidatus Woesebacteria bacterium GW2011_GWB1_38_5b]OGC97840.1 MAG: hypothetical protein A2634_05485 [Candidatus Amesbacteria bacterium RIFCSPHIGHO2_01_FULL_48_32]OGD03151.1 MAG: hypothetical protein A2989_02330 [Candidatus Amesbacteria bacterium RIFCSPLOWO2_01_FULL_48_25]OGM39058.1 MAG: hypothetical protein A3E13_03935 [Candidatus Woesebacteria bacterium RIFCSPHIGHO2_12_FULL_40_20]